ncbi:LOW QUALITY PROTEIN: uncharacterized protein ARIH2OS [Neophocaena asiaeorientalis asiaeorientalis]|uniref:LOW QUALITY PROTEIN: uncharacterized protein ARIH2OS n=1 Tax=Neophocaena asiaeorientalis asiaeorientalis TaxID=1706337 RepID=A0A341AU58_NEOAA|nr:LOW QUALITY PROTEIN: uncharacterized protein ARIH2OS [Neophocaena asiaeorientalis asiaeorientalis]
MTRVGSPEGSASAGAPGGEGPDAPAPVGQRRWPPTSLRAEQAAKVGITERRQAPVRPGLSLQPPLGGWRSALKQCKSCQGRRDLAGSDEGGALAELGRRAESPPPPPARRGKQGLESHRALTGSRGPAAAEPGRARPGRAGPEEPGPGAAAAEAAGQARSRSALLPPAKPSQQLRKCSEQFRHFRPGVDPRSPGSRQALGSNDSLRTLRYSPALRPKVGPEHSRCRRLREAAEERIRLIGEWSRHLFRLLLTSAARRDTLNQGSSVGLPTSLFVIGVRHRQDIQTFVEWKKTVVSRPLSSRRKARSLGQRAGPGISAYVLRPSPGGPIHRTTPGFRFPLRGLVRCLILWLPIHPRLNLNCLVAQFLQTV